MNEIQNVVEYRKTIVIGGRGTRIVYLLPANILGVCGDLRQRYLTGAVYACTVLSCRDTKSTIRDCTSKTTTTTTRYMAYLEAII